MTGAAIDWRLTGGTRPGTLADFADAWLHHDIIATLPGMAAFVAAPSLLNKVRGALGTALLASASDAVKARRPCDWPQTCTAEVLFGSRPLIRLDGHDSQIATPFVLAGRSQPDGSLALSLRVLGLASEWSQSAAAAFATALSTGVRWDQLARDAGRPAPRHIRIDGLRIVPTRKPAHPAPGALIMVFRTPVAVERANIADDPQLLLGAMSRRLALLAPWFGLTPSGVLDAATVASKSGKILIDEPLAKFQPGYGGHRMRNRLAWPPVLRVISSSADLQIMLQLAAFSHVGRSASTGLGRFDIVFVSEVDAIGHEQLDI